MFLICDVKIQIENQTLNFTLFQRTISDSTLYTLFFDKLRISKHF